MPTSSTAPKRVALAAAGSSLILVVALGVAYALYDSQLALSQAADSFGDTLTQIVLAVSLFIAARPPDADHQFGHQRAEPIAALVAAVMIGVVSVEVAREAVEALLSEHEPSLHWYLPVVFGAKALVKLVLMVISRSSESSVIRAIYVDSRNDVALSVLAIGGFFAARQGWRSLDAWLALPIAAWIGGSAIALARETLPLLMGEAPPVERQRELEAIAKAVPGVLRAALLRAQHVGADLDLDLRIEAEPATTLEDARRLGSRVEERLLEEDDVGHVMVHAAPLSEEVASSGEPVDSAAAPANE